MTEHDVNRIFKKIFILMGIAVFLLFLGQLWKNYNRPYIGYQDTFKELMLQKGTSAGKPGAQLGIRQEWIKDLDRADRCETCHLGIDDPRFSDAPQPFKTHPTGGHPFDKFGCTVCHNGQGLATTTEDAHGPAENWFGAIYHEDFMENSCSLCHGEFIKDQAPVFSKGRGIFNDYGCRGCHKVGGKEKVMVGPPLDNMGKKVKTDWLYRWILNPKGYLPKTKMPNPKLRSDEAANIAAFLLQGPKAEGAPISGDRARGKTMLLESRCVSCHTIEGKGGKVAAELSRVSSKNYPRLLFETIQNPHALWSESRMPIFGFPEKDIGDIVAFMADEYVDLDLEEEQSTRQIELVGKANAARGRELAEKYACNGCHSKIEGIKERAELAPELTTISSAHISRLDFGNIEVRAQQRTVPNWLYNKVLNPRLFKPDLKMPDFSFTTLEAEAPTTYLLSLTGKEVRDSYILPLGEPPSQYAPQGPFGKVLDKYRCIVCHTINGKGGEIANDLSQEGSRVQEKWLLKFMKAPDTIRPILEERMPAFKITDQEDDTVRAYCRVTLVDDRVEDLAETVGKMALLDPDLIREGKKLYSEKYACNACHQIQRKGGLIGPDLTEVQNRLRPEWIVYHLHDPKTFTRRSVEPVYGFSAREIEALTAFLVNPKPSP